MTPRATYRLQFHKDFSFRDAAKVSGYLASLGISHVYASPWLKARPGSLHGYDIVDHKQLNPELGDEAAFDEMISSFGKARLGSILDFVPNHMGVGGSDNPLWLDVLEWGPDATYAGWFDIDWQPDRVSQREKLLAPVLGKQYGTELYDGKLTLKFDPSEGSFAVWAYDTHKLPICPLHYDRILGDSDAALEQLGDAFATLREWRPQITRRAGDLKAQLANEARERPGVAEAIDHALARFNGSPGEPDSWKELNALIQDQNWRAAHFRVAADDINYRRFFDINDLAGLRMELPEVLEPAHSLVLKLVSEGKLDGLRIDHVDGLLNPKHYLQWLDERLPEDSYLIVEKILAHHESLRNDWPVDGTTGYDFTNQVLQLFIDPAGEIPLTEHYAAFTGERRRFPEIVRECKMRIMRNEMASELNVLAREAARVACEHPRTADFTQNVLRRAIREIVACFPVYRTYVDWEGNPTAEDRRDLNWAMKQARANDTDIDPTVFDFVGDLLSGDLVAHSRSGFSRHAVLRCAMKLQQYSGPVMAKGLEDTAFYRYNRLIALNEVGGYPDLFGSSVSAFHKANEQRLRFWPHSMLTTSTHDTKRGEDARARLAVISEMPDVWAKQTRLWSKVLRARRADIEATAPPEQNDEYLFYQMLLGSWPVELMSIEDFKKPCLAQYLDRVRDAMRKSIREAKVHSTWASPDMTYENAVMDFIEGALDPESSSAFLSEFLPFALRIAQLGMENSLVQTALKLTAPGVPDTYQGSELWELSLVDPDNRRPVDYALRAAMLKRLDEAAPSMQSLMREWGSGAVKLFLTSRILRLRAAEPDLFAEGGYEALLANGPRAERICGFTRRKGSRAVVVITALFPARRQLEPGWPSTSIALPQELSQVTFRSLFSEARLAASDVEEALDFVFDGSPVAVLIAD